MNRIIGVTGRAGSGKDTVYQVLKTEFAGREVNRLAFADLLKKSAMSSLNLNMALVDEFKLHGIVEVRFGSSTSRTLSGREFLQRYGAEGHREIFGTDFWVDAALANLKPGVTVITDVRYNNEAEAIIAMGGVIWDIHRPGELIKESEHSSEQAVDYALIDQIIMNDGSKTDFRKRVLWAWGDQPQTFMDFDSQALPPATVPLFPDSLANKDLKHNYLERKHLSERAALIEAELSES